MTEQRRRILFVNADANVTAGFKRMLRRQSGQWDMHFVGSADAALTHIHAHPVDVLVTDWILPGYGGAQLLKQVAAHDPSIIRVVLTGSTDSQDSTMALRLAQQMLFMPVDAETLRDAINQTCLTRDIVDNPHIREVVGGIHSLPSLPSLYSRITRALDDENSTMRSIAELIAQDVAMTAKILQLVNSAFFGLGNRISSVEQAATLLGINQLRSLILVRHLADSYPARLPCAGFSIDRLYRDAFATAELARRIALQARKDTELADQAYTAGMLNTVGTLLMAAHMPEEYARILTAAHEQELPLHEAEQERLGITHAEVGAYLLGVWNLPGRIVEAVARHYHPSNRDEGEFSALSALHIARALLRDCKSGSDELAGLDRGYVESLGLSKQLPGWQELAREIYARSSGDTEPGR